MTRVSNNTHDGHSINRVRRQILSLTLLRQGLVTRISNSGDTVVDLALLDLGHRRTRCYSQSTSELLPSNDGIVRCHDLVPLDGRHKRGQSDTK